MLYEADGFFGDFGDLVEDFGVVEFIKACAKTFGIENTIWYF